MGAIYCIQIKITLAKLYKLIDEWTALAAWLEYLDLASCGTIGIIVPQAKTEAFEVRLDLTRKCSICREDGLAKNHGTECKMR